MERPGVVVDYEVHDNIAFRGSAGGDEGDDDVCGVEAEQHGESGTLCADPFGGEEELAEFSSVESSSFGWVDLWSANVLCRVGCDSSVDVRANR